MHTKNSIWQYLSAIGLLSTSVVNADPINSRTTLGTDALYSPPIVREATAEWPDPDPEEALYQANDPEYYHEDALKQTVLNTQKQGNNHFIEVTFTGPSDVEIESQLMIDTGASFIVLPMAMMEDFFSMA